MASKKNLTMNEERVLIYLCENKNREPSSEEISETLGLSDNETSEALNSLVEMGYVSGPPSLLQTTMDALREMDDKLTPVSNKYAEHVILLASFLGRADEKFLAANLGYEPDLVNIVGSRLRASGIWSGHSVLESHVHEWMKSGTAFWLDVAVGCGDLQIVSRSPEPQYQMTPGGKSRVEAMLRK